MKEKWFDLTYNSCAQVKNARTIITNLLLIRLKEHIPSTPLLCQFKDILENWTLDTYDSSICPSLFETICYETYKNIEWSELIEDPLHFICNHPSYRQLYQSEFVIQLNDPQALSVCIEEMTKSTSLRQIIEVGTGTGGFTRRLFPFVQDQIKRYVATDCFKIDEFKDLSPTILQRKQLDINMTIPNDLKEQFDLIVSCNCIHVSKNIVDCLNNLSQLVPNKGYLLLEEAIDDYPLVMFGLDDFVWTTPEDKREFGLWMTYSTWLKYIGQTSWIPQLCYRSKYQMMMVLQKN